MKLTKINNKYELWLPDHRAARPEWQTGWEVERIEHMLSNLNKGDLVVDVGTEEGDISALLAQQTGEIVLFEPNHKVWPNIKAIFRDPRNKLPDPAGMFVGFASNYTDYKGHRIDDIAILNHAVKAVSWPGCADNELIGDHGFKELVGNQDIPEIRIDDFIHQLAMSPRLITIDVEGGEFEVLKGSENVLRSYRPHLYVSIHPEFMFRMFSQYTAELVKFVEDLGYKHEVLAFDHEFHFYFKPL